MEAEQRVAMSVLCCQRFAVSALLVNIVLILGALSALQATLTLPGIAGIVLTMGMAVDANVLIFERIREEMRAGRSVQQAIHHGYDAAFSSILDANITTFIVGIVLYQFGTGPIQGFAVTLMLGIVATLIATLLFLRSKRMNYFCIFLASILSVA